MQTLNRIRRVVQTLALVAVAGVQGCLGGVTEPVNATGTFTLQTINSSALPYTFANGVVLKSEVLSLKSDGTYTDTITRADNTVVVDVGNYTVVGTLVVFADVTLTTAYQGTLSGNKLTIDIPGFTEIFARGS